MKTVFEDVMWYALGNKKPNHKKGKEYKNITKIQDFLDLHMGLDEFYTSNWNAIMNRRRGVIK